MTRSKPDIRRHGLIADWLQDVLSSGVDITGQEHKHARDLVKYLKANGWNITPCTSSYQEGDDTQPGTSCRPHLQVVHQEDKRMSH